MEVQPNPFIVIDTPGCNNGGKPESNGYTFTVLSER